MKEYRISKYDPQFRVNGAYQKNEWTSISDIGKVFDDGGFPAFRSGRLIKVSKTAFFEWMAKGSETVPRSDK